MPVDRAALRYAQARLALDHLEDEERGLTLLEQTLEEDPSHAEARSALTRLRSSLTPPEPMPVPREESIAAPPPQEALLTEIRDLLKPQVETEQQRPTRH